MMSITVLDIFGRSLGLFTIDSGVEQSDLMMTLVAFFGLARCVHPDTTGRPVGGPGP